MNVQELPKVKKTQASRRLETQQLLLASACKIFGGKGYEATSLEEIAADVNLTISPIYHYFGNKLNLFTEVNKMMEQRLSVNLVSSAPDNIGLLWNAFLDTCKTPGFVQIVLVDAPHILGREKWMDSIVTNTLRELLVTHYNDAYIFKATTALSKLSAQDQELIMRMLFSALAEVALMIGRNPDYDSSQVLLKIQDLLKI